MKLKKFKDGWAAYIGAFVWGFIMIFLLLYIGKFGLTDLVLPNTSKWTVLFNVSLWTVMMFTALEFFYKEYDKLTGMDKVEVNFK